MKINKIIIILSVVLFFSPILARAAIADNTVWEFRATGSNNNGGGFYNRNPGTSVDYSQQDAAQLNLTNLATNGAGTGLSSVTGGFTAAMVGNIINITAGTGFTPGWYEITAYADTNNVTIDRSAGASASSGTGYIGGARAVPTDAFFEQLTAGNIVYFKIGTYTLTENIITASTVGTAADPVVVEGYNSARGDNPTGDNRPTIVASTYDWRFVGSGNNTYMTFRNLIVTSINSNGAFYLYAYATVENCKAIQSSASAYNAFYIASGFVKIINSEAVSTNGNAIDARGYSEIIGCYIHDSSVGIYTYGSVILILHNIIDTCTTGIYGGDTNYFNKAVMNNTIYNCTTGISVTVAERGWLVANNIIDSCTTGASWSSEVKNSWWDYNNWHNNGTDVSNVTKGDNALALDPQFTDAANGDFSIGTNLKAQGFLGVFPGSLSTGYLDVGAAQRQEPGIPGIKIKGGVKIK